MIGKIFLPNILKTHDKYDIMDGREKTVFSHKTILTEDIQMKKWLLCLLAVLMVLPLAACAFTDVKDANDKEFSSEIGRASCRERV